jgi:hypothetical protein
LGLCGVVISVLKGGRSEFVVGGVAREVVGAFLASVYVAVVVFTCVVVFVGGLVVFDCVG